MKRNFRNLIAAGAALTTVAALPAAASAAPVVNGTFNLPGGPKQMTLGPDGNVWVTLAKNGDVAKVTPDGTVTPYDLDAANISGLVGITDGPDGNLWATMLGAVVKFSPANPVGTAVKTPVATITTANSIARGPDGNLWTGSADQAIRIPPAAPATSTPFPVKDAANNALDARGIAAGGDGLIYIADFSNKEVMSINTAGAFVRAYPAGDGVQQVAAGPGTQVGFTAPSNIIGRITPGVAAPATTTVTGTDPFGIRLGADGNYWVAQFNADAVSRVTPAGVSTVFPIAGLPANYGPRYLTAGAGNTIWVGIELPGDDDQGKIVRVTGVDPAPTGGGGGTGGGTGGSGTKDTTKPVISGAALSAASLRAGQARSIRFTLSEAAAVTFRFQRALAGKRKGKACVRPTRALRRAKSCVRYATVRTRTVTGRAGANRVAFNAKFGKSALPAGSYRVTMTAKDGAGNVSAVRSAKFKVLKPRKR
jgi:virginiamycin B lyase